MPHILSVVGARPNFMKVAALDAAFRTQSAIRHSIVHTGQHYDEKMSDIFFREMALPEPDVFMGVGGGSHARQTAAIMQAFEDVVLEMAPDAVLVVGDVNSTMACSLVASKLHVPIVHVEAGLRSGDRGMPEEINRIVTDAIADVLYVSDPSGMDFLEAEGVPASKVHFVGNVMIDSLHRYRPLADARPVLDDWALSPGGYILLTLHRPATVDSADGLARMAGVFEALAGEWPDQPLVFPIHPRTRANMERFGLADRFAAIRTLQLHEPVGYLDFLKLQSAARFIVTDSGGIQEESTILEVPCLTLRPNTERPVTITHGTNVLLPPDTPDLAGRVLAYVREANEGRWKTAQPIDGWDGHAAERIAADLLTRF
ncbi:MAG: UDP-N-acetylglucosamine 2-epimerase (non-hydrolyzing) [Rhodothermales bacterium]